MGSFNVACSMSNISINCGTKIAFIPLLPSEMNETIGNKYNKFNLKPGYVFLEPSANWVSNEGAFQFYKPFSLPIFGEYNDYGGIENIEENITSKAITEYFGITIEEFVDCIGSGREDYSWCSPIFDAYFSVDKKLISDYGVKFNEKWLINMGFTKLENGTFQFKDHPYAVLLFKVAEDKKNHKQAGFGYEIFSLKNIDLKNNKDTIPQYDLEIVKHEFYGHSVKKNSDTYDNREKFLETYLEISGYHLGYKEEHHDKIRLLRKMSGMFVHKDIYDLMSKNSFSEYSLKTDASSWENEADLNEDSLKKLGFKFRCEDKSIERYSNVWEYPGVTDYVMHSDGTWSHIAKTSYKHLNGNPKQEQNIVQYGVYHPNSLIKAWKELTNIEIVIDEAKRKESKYGASFDQIREQYMKFVSGQDEDDDVKEINRKSKERANLMKSSPEAFKKEVDDLKADKVRFEIFKSIFSMSMDDAFESDDSVAVDIELTDEQIGNHLIKRLEEKFVGYQRNPLEEPEGHIHLPLKPRYDKYNMLITLYEPNVVDGSIRQDIIDFCSFYWNCYSMNRVLMPASNGCQFGCHAATYHLAKKTMEIMEEQMKDFDEDYDEEE